MVNQLHSARTTWCIGRYQTPFLSQKGVWLARLGQELGQAVKAKNLEGQAVKGTSLIRKSQGSSTVKGQPDTKSHQSTIPHLVEQVLEQVRSRVKGLFEWRSSGQGPNSRSNFLTAVAGVSTESIGVTSPCNSYNSKLTILE